MIGSIRSWLTSDTRLRIWGYVAPELRRSSATSLPAFGQKSPALRVRVLPPLGCFGGDLFGRRDSAQSHPYIPRISGIMSNQVGNAHDPPDRRRCVEYERVGRDQYRNTDGVDFCLGPCPVDK